MAMRLSKVPTTADELEAIPDDGNRYEIINGELFVSPSPSWTHQRVVRELVLRLAPYADAIGLELIFAPMDVRASDDTQVEPDAFVVPLRDDGRRTTRWEPMARLLLAIEVLSPSTRRLDLELKRELYLGQGVREYWIVDAETRSVSVWAPGHATPRVESDLLIWHPIVERENLTVHLPTLFRIVHRGE